jgi:hypothetical protein
MAEKKLPGSEIIEAALLAAPQVQAQITERYRIGLVQGALLASCSAGALYLAPKYAGYALAGIAAGTFTYAMVRKNIA